MSLRGEVIDGQPLRCCQHNDCVVVATYRTVDLTTAKRAFIGMCANAIADGEKIARKNKRLKDYRSRITTLECKADDRTMCGCDGCEARNDARQLFDNQS